MKQRVNLLKLKRGTANKRVSYSSFHILADDSVLSLAVEKFHSFREVHGAEWHANRHNLGQVFLDAFVRQASLMIVITMALFVLIISSRTSLKSTKFQLHLKSSMWFFQPRNGRFIWNLNTSCEPWR